jgi:hypothetical protein
MIRIETILEMEYGRGSMSVVRVTARGTVKVKHVEETDSVQAPI